MIGNVILYFSESIWITYLAMLVFGLGFGFAVSIKPIIFLDFCFDKKCLLLFSFKKGLISALVTSIGNLGAAAYNFLGESFINKENYTLDEKEEYYPYDIAKNVKTYYLFIFIAEPVGTVLGTLLIFQYRPDLSELNQESKEQDSEKNPQDFSDKNTQEEPPVISQDNSKENPILPKSPDFPGKSINEQDKQQLKKVMKQIIKHRRIWILSGINFLASFLFLLVVNTFKTIGATVPTRVDA